MIAVLVAVCLTVLLGVVAIALDGGRLWSERRQAQSVADAAALAAACDLYENYWVNSGRDPDGTALASALATAASNGYADDKTDSVVTVNIPPQSGDYTGKRGYVEVIVQYNQRRSFSKVFGTGTMPVRARAVGLGSAVAADVGILVLDPSVKGALNVHGGGSGGVVNVNDTSVVVDSNSSEAAIANGSIKMTAPEYRIVGDYTTTGGGLFVGDMRTHSMGMNDPLAHIPPPDPGSLTVQSNKKVQYTSGNVTLEPGVYRNGISVSGSGSLTLSPGIYYMDGGGFSFSGQGSLQGEGVMIYNSPGNGNGGGIDVSGQGSLILHGPTSGQYKGLTMFQDRTSTVPGNVQGSGGGGTTDITGTFYFANALLKVGGNGGVANIGSQYISRTLDIGGNGAIEINWKPEKVVPGRNIYLVE